MRGYDEGVSAQIPLKLNTRVPVRLYLRLYRFATAGPDSDKSSKS